VKPAVSKEVLGGGTSRPVTRMPLSMRYGSPMSEAASTAWNDAWPAVLVTGAALAP
jgi:hypothetical protein